MELNNKYENVNNRLFRKESAFQTAANTMSAYRDQAQGRIFGATKKEYTAAKSTRIQSKDVTTKTIYKIVKHLKQNESVTPTSICNNLGVNYRAVKLTIKLLEDLDLLETQSSKHITLVNLKCQTASLKS